MTKRRAPARRPAGRSRRAARALDGCSSRGSAEAGGDDTRTEVACIDGDVARTTAAGGKEERRRVMANVHRGGWSWPEGAIEESVPRLEVWRGPERGIRRVKRRPRRPREGGRGDRKRPRWRIRAAWWWPNPKWRRRGNRVCTSPPLRGVQECGVGYEGRSHQAWSRAYCTQS